jgi:AhpC/TSA family
MEDNTEVKPANKFWRAMAFAVLFLLPIGSVVYLYMGRAHSRTAVAELESLGQVTGFQLKNQQNEPISPESLHGKVTVVNFLPKDISQAKPLADRIEKVHQSFDDTDDVIFLTFIESDTSMTLLQTATQLGIGDHKQWYLLGTSSDEWQHLSADVYHLPNPLTTVAMADTSLTIRKLYEINNNQQMGRMVEHIAKVVPKQKRR